MEPTIYEFQEGFLFPNFFVSHDVLRKLCILSDNTAQMPPIQQYNHVLDTWIHFNIGHMVTLHDCDGGALLVKNTCVKNCVDLGHHLQKLTHPSSPNIAKALPAEHKYMHAASRAKSSCPPSPLNDPLMHDNVGSVPTIHDSRASNAPSWPLTTIDDDDDYDDNISPVPTIHHSQQCSTSILSLTDSKEETTATAHSPKRCPA